MKKSRYLLECCVDSLASAEEAAKGGADRLELCSNLIIGGTTPSPILLSQIRERVSLPVYALIRPRSGDFLYADAEIAQMRAEIELLKEYGADGFVIGCLRADGALDTQALSSLMEACKGLPVTLHRAFDLCRNAFEALESAKKLGISTILTSGQKNTCMEGLPMLKKLSDKESQDSKTPLRIMAGSGVNADVIRALLRQSAVTAFHMSGKRAVHSAMQYRNPDVLMGSAALDEYAVWQTDSAEIKKAKEELRLSEA